MNRRAFLSAFTALGVGLLPVPKVLATPALEFEATRWAFMWPTPAKFGLHPYEVAAALARCLDEIHRLAQPAVVRHVDGDEYEAMVVYAEPVKEITFTARFGEGVRS